MSKVNEADLEWSTLSGGETGLRRKKLAAAADGEDVGCSLYELPAGDRSWPYHYHTGNEEALFVLDGEGVLRLDGERVPLEAGDYVALPADERGAHRVINDSEGTLRYLMISTMKEPDVMVYPDSGKVGVFAGAPPGGEGERTVHGYYRREDAVDYREGE
ncbi:cupin [Halobacteriales archaeon SW_5_68_122]|nr:MAG: cupin [Halobacteriales archaeon SW_5_68_122]